MSAGQAIMDTFVSLEREIIQLKAEKADLLEALEQLKKNGRRYQQLKELFFGCDFNYGEDQLNVLIFDLPKGVSVSANLDSTVDRIIAKAEGAPA